MLVQTEVSQLQKNFGFKPSLSDKLRAELISVGFDSDIFVSVKSEWSSVNQDYRGLIREDLYNQLAKSCEVVRREFEDLSQIPKHTNYHISISHCRTFGGYTCISKPHIIGFDVESLQRVTGKILNRISNPKDDFDTVVNPAFIWVAKEAAFKVLQYVSSIKVIQEVMIRSWSMKSANVFEFQVANVIDKNKLVTDITGEVNGDLLCVDESRTMGCVIFEGDSAFAFYLLYFGIKGGVA
jgi:phosphopantetheinyl transferase (holo-ACP synthase)